MSVLAVIPCLNEAQHLAPLIRQMMADPAIDQIVVADGGSTDGSREIVAQLSADARLILLDNPQRIQSAGINLAVRRFGANHTWLLRIDAHCLYPQGYASLLLRAANAHTARSVVVPMVTVGSTGFQKAAAAAQNSILGTGGSPHRHLGGGQYVDHGHHALMDLRLFRAVGGYCEAMPCNEDAELDYRFNLAGGKIWLEPSGALTYFPRPSVRLLWRQYFRYGIGRARNLRRHRMRPKIRQLVPLLVPTAFVLSALSPISLLFVLPLAAWLALTIFVGVVIGLRQGGGWALAAGLAAAVMQLSWALGFITEWITNPAAGQAKYGLKENRGC